MLPTSNMSASRLPSKLPEFVRRVIHRDQMEVDSALSQMWALATANPSLIFKLNKARKMTKNHYYRDDPAFMVLQLLFLAVTTISFGVALGAPILLIVFNVIYQIAIDYIVLGALVATAMWTFANRVLMGNPHSLHEVRRDVEWQYAFDIHGNSYFPYFICTHVVQFLFLPLLMHHTFFAQLLANALYALGATLYCYVSFRSYLDLPMLTKQQLLLYPVIGIVALCVLVTVTTNISMTRFMVHHVWPAAVQV